MDLAILTRGQPLADTSPPRRRWRASPSQIPHRRRTLRGQRKVTARTARYLTRVAQSGRAPVISRGVLRPAPPGPRTCRPPVAVTPWVRACRTSIWAAPRPGRERSSDSGSDFVELTLEIDAPDVVKAAEQSTSCLADRDDARLAGQHQSSLRAAVLGRIDVERDSGRQPMNNALRGLPSGSARRVEQRRADPAASPEYQRSRLVQRNTQRDIRAEPDEYDFDGQIVSE